MNKLYQEGGLADDGADIEPVTGNEVPTGSMSQEVRDDIPTNLSEGEYVVPADVVRYYGVKFFEDLRGKAKEDFARMEEEGRVGGEPVDSNGVPMEQDEELTPEEMQMLAEALGEASSDKTGMAMGGMVPQQQQAAYDPYTQQQMQYTQPQPVFQSSRVGMQEGGDVTGFNPNDYSYGGSFESPFGGKSTGFNPNEYAFGNSFEDPLKNYNPSQDGMRLVEYVNPSTGQTRMITVLNGEPIGLVPDGFVPASSEAKKQARDTKQQVDTRTQGTGQQREKEGSGLGPDGVGTPETASIEGMTDAQLGKAHSDIGKVGTALGMVAGPLGSMVAKSAQKAVENEMKERDLEVPEEQSLVEQVQDLLGIETDVAEVSDIDAPDVVSEGEEGFAEAMAAAAPPGMSVSRDSTGSISGYSQSPSEAAATASTPSAQATAQEGIAAVSAARGSQSSSSSGGSGSSSGSSSSSSSSGGGMSSGADTPGQGTDRYKGGLMGSPKGSANKKKRKPNQRKKPIKNKKKGLASK